MAKKQSTASKKASVEKRVRSLTKAAGMKMPHGYEIKVRKKK